MQVSCPQCTAKLQLSAAKLPDHPFIIKCPKCECGFQVTPEKQLEETLEIAPSSSAPVPAPAAASSVVPMSAPVSNAQEAPISQTPQLSEPAPAPSFAAPSQLTSPAPIQPTREMSPTPPHDPVVKAPVRPASDLSSSFSPGMAAVGFTNSMPAPTAWDDSHTLVAPHRSGGNPDLLQALTSLLLSAAGDRPIVSMPQSRRRYVVACLSNEEDFATIKTILGEQEYFVTAAESPEQVTSLLQSSHELDILLLDPAFHAEEQGGASIMRYLNMLNPARRRRVFVVVISQTYKTMDTQAAFSHGVNMIVNMGELEMLPNTLAHSISDFNNLYRAFNVASGIAPF